MNHRRKLLVGLVSLLLAGLNTDCQARGGGHGGGGGFHGGGGYHASSARVVASHPNTGSHYGRGRRFGGRGGRGGYGGYYGDQGNEQQPVSSNFQSSHFSGPDHISPSEYGNFVKNYSCPGQAPVSTQPTVSSQPTVSTLANPTTK